MDKIGSKYLYEELTRKIIKCFYTVFDELGSGFLESVYEKALLIEFKQVGLKAKNQSGLNVKYKDVSVGEFKADIVVENKVIIEIKAVNRLNSYHEAQLINYLKATNIKIGLLVNFGETLELKRRIY